LTAAIEYLEKWGLCPIPLCPWDHQVPADADEAEARHAASCQKPGKVPRINGWEEYANRKPAVHQLRLLWARNRHYNVGLVMGPAGNLCGLDIDSAVGEQFLLEAADGKVPETWQFTTGKGRRLLFQWPSGFELPTKSLRVDGVEHVKIQAAGSQTVAPPSKHFTGIEYEWVHGCRPGEVPLLQCPKWVLRLAAMAADLKARPKTVASPGIATDTPPNVRRRASLFMQKYGPPADGRGDHNRTLWIADNLVVGFELSDEEAVQLFEEEWNPRCVTPDGKPRPWSPQDLHRKCQEARKHTKNQPGYRLREKPMGSTSNDGTGNGSNGSNGSTSDARSSNHAKAQPRPKGEPVIRTMKDIQPRKLEWLWPGKVLRRAVTVLDGDPGLGKSTITTDLTARVSRGWKMPPESGQADGVQPQGALLLSAEDDPETTIRPRLDAAGADPGRIYIFEAIKEDGGERPPVLPWDMDLVESTIDREQIALVVVDPFMAFLDGKLDAHRDQDVRRCMHRLKLLAERTGAAILVVRHLNKLIGGPAMYRGGGSIGITGAARGALIVGRNPQRPAECVLATVKCNLAKRPMALTYSLEDEGGVARVGWGDECDLTADDILGHPGSKKKQTDKCVDYVLDILADGRMKSEEFEASCKAAGFSERSIKTARKKLKVVATKDSFTDVWWVSLPPEEADGDEDEDAREGD
jgi:hypothetical protein